MTAALLSPCTTSMLWDAADPDEYIAISMDEVTEQELQEKGLEYEVDQDRGMYFVEKSILQKTRDYVYRSFGTPVTVVIDVATPVLVVGGITYIITYHSAHPPNTYSALDLPVFLDYLGL